jgi:hypothetical protein
MSGRSGSEALLGRLSGLRDLLRASDPTAALGAAQGLRETCDALASEGARMDPEVLHKARELHAECQAAASVLVGRVSNALVGAGNGRRASSAYGVQRRLR